MSKKTIATDSAFVKHTTMVNGQLSVDDNSSGLTKREYFAAKALQGVLAASSVSVGQGGFNHIRPDVAASFAVCHADALIKTLNDKD